MSGGKGGSQTSQVEIPAYLENASKKSLNRAEATQNIGYMPYMGPDVAAFTQPQQQAMQSNIDAAAAFGLVDPGLDAMAGMPQAEDFNGVQGYSSFPMYQMAVDDLKASRPGQVEAYDDLYVDPITGQGGHNNGYPSFPGHAGMSYPGVGSIGNISVDYDPYAGSRATPSLPETRGGELPVRNPMPEGPFVVADPMQLPGDTSVFNEPQPVSPPMPLPVMQPAATVEPPSPLFSAAASPAPVSSIPTMPASIPAVQPALNQGLDMSGLTGSIPTYNTKMSAKPQLRNSKKRK
jgi:hypothetical protein